MRCALLLTSLVLAAGSGAAKRPSRSGAKPGVKPRAAVAHKPRRRPVAKPVESARPATPATPEPIAPEGPAPDVMHGPLNLPLLMREARAEVTSSPLAAGNLESAFDSNRHTYADLSGPGSIRIVLNRPRPIEEIDLEFGAGGRFQWSVQAADSAADLEKRRGTFRVLVSPRAIDGEKPDQATFADPRPFRVYALECSRVQGEGPIPLAEWALWAPQEISRIQVQAFAPDVARGARLPLRADALYEAGAHLNLTSEVTWEVSPVSAGSVDPLGRLVGGEPAPAKVIAEFRRWRSAPLEVAVLPEARPDWDVTFIERQPRSDFSQPNRGPKLGDKVYWFAHVKNYGTADAGPVRAEWRIDGHTVRAGMLPPIERFGETEVMLSTTADALRHIIELVVNSSGDLPEVTRANNDVAVYTDAAPVGMWVEDATYRYFHQNQRTLGIGSNSWEDWAQRQVATWNRWMDAAPCLFTAPGDDHQRWRLDRVLVLGDGMLPLSGGSPGTEPDRSDHSTQVCCGFPAYDPTRSNLYARTRDTSSGNPFMCQSALFPPFAGKSATAARAGLLKR